MSEGLERLGEVLKDRLRRQREAYEVLCTEHAETKRRLLRALDVAAHFATCEDHRAGYPCWECGAARQWLSKVRCQCEDFDTRDGDTCAACHLPI